MPRAARRTRRTAVRSRASACSTSRASSQAQCAGGRSPVRHPSSPHLCPHTLTVLPDAAHGADVLWITSPTLPALPALDIDTSRGKRTAQLDLARPADRAALHALVGGTDVFLQAYRPGGLAAKGFGVADVVRARPGVVYASLNAYGWDGPWRGRRGVRVYPLRVCVRADGLLVRLARADRDGLQRGGGRGVCCVCR